MIYEWLAAVLFWAAATGPAFDAAYRAGLQALQENRLPEAQSQLEAASKMQPRNPQVWLALAQTYFKEKKKPMADAAALRAETLGAADPVVLQALAFYFAESQNPAKAAVFETRYAEKSQDEQAYVRAVQLYLSAKQMPQAIATAQKALLRGHDLPDLHELLANCYDSTNQFSKATQEYGLALKARPFDESYYFQYAEAFLRREKFSEALQVLDAARERFDKSAQIELARGVALYGLRRFPETVDAFLKTIALAPDIDQPYLFLGRMLDVVEDKMPEVSGALASYASMKPNDSVSSFLYAKALLAQQAEPDQVEPLLRKSIQLNPAYWESHFELGTVLEKRSDWTGAVQEYRKSIELNAKASAPHYRLARVYERLGKTQDAVAERAVHARLEAAEKAAVGHGIAGR